MRSFLVRKRGGGRWISSFLHDFIKLSLPSSIRFNLKKLAESSPSLQNIRIYKGSWIFTTLPENLPMKGVQASCNLNSSRIVLRFIGFIGECIRNDLSLFQLFHFFFLSFFLFFSRRSMKEEEDIWNIWRKRRREREEGAVIISSPRSVFPTLKRD